MAPINERQPAGWFDARARVCIALTALTITAVAVSLVSSDSSYVLWASCGIASALLMMIGTVVGVSLLIVGVKEGTPQAIVWPVLLLCTTALPLLLILVGGAVLGL
jgi:hypothetical protein